MNQGFDTCGPTYQEFRAHAHFVPELEDFAVNERQFAQLLAQVEMHWGGGGLGTGDLPILFNQAVAGAAPALGGQGSVCGMLVRNSGHLTYEGVRSICKVIAARTSKARHSFVDNTIAIAEKLAAMEAEAQPERSPNIGDESPMLQFLRRSISRASTRGLSNSSTMKLGGMSMNMGRSRKERPATRKAPVTSNLTAAMAECEAPPVEAGSSEGEEEVWQVLMPGRQPKAPSPSREVPAALTASPRIQGNLKSDPASLETSVVAGFPHSSLHAEGAVKPQQGESVQGEGTLKPLHSPIRSSAGGGGGVRFGGEDRPTLDPYNQDGSKRSLQEESKGGGYGARSTKGWLDVEDSYSGASRGDLMASMLLSGDPPVLIKEALLPPACEFAAVRTVVNRIQALISKGDLVSVGPMLAPLLTDWEAAATEKQMRDAVRRAKQAKQARAKSKAAGAAPETEEPEDDGAPKEVPPEAAVWLLLVAGRVALGHKKLHSAKMFMGTAWSYLGQLPPSHSYHTTVPMCQGIVAYTAGDHAEAAQHFSRAHARAQSIAGCACNPLASRNAAASLNNWGAALAMQGEKAMAVRCFRSALSLLDTQSPPGCATAPPKPPPPDPAASRPTKRPASAPAGKGKGALKPPAWGGGGSLDTLAATTAAANLKHVLHATFANGPSSLDHNPHTTPFSYPSYGRRTAGVDQLPAVATISSLSHSLTPSANSGLRGAVRPGSSRSAVRTLANSTNSPHLLSGFALATHPHPSNSSVDAPRHQGSFAAAPSSSMPSSQGGLGKRPASASTMTSRHSLDSSNLTQAPSRFKTFISSVISSPPSQAPVESLPPWAVRATEASMEEKAKKKGSSGSAKKAPPPVRGDAKAAPKKKKPTGFQITFPADYYGQPSYSAANVKGLVDKKVKKAAATR